MGQIKFSRIDSRLIHGQIVTKWTKGVGANSVYVVDDTVANDSFMRTILEGSGKTYGFKVRVYSKQEVLDEWNKNQFNNEKVFIIFKDIPSALDVVEMGLPIPNLNVGGIPKKDGSTQINASVFLTKDNLEKLQKIKEERNIDVFIQTVPDTVKLDILEVKV